MEYLQENNISRYQVKVNYNLTYCITKIKDIYIKKDGTNRINRILRIKSLTEEETNNIIKYCRDNNYIENYDNMQYLYFNDMIKSISDSEEHYYKEVNILHKIKKEFIDYVNLVSDITVFKFPSLTEYDDILNRKVHSFMKVIKVENEAFVMKDENIIIKVSLFNNKVLVSLLLGTNDKKYSISDNIIDEIKTLMQNVNVEIDKEYLRDTFSLMQKKY